jgi:hypothetical protein
VTQTPDDSPQDALTRPAAAVAAARPGAAGGDGAGAARGFGLPVATALIMGSIIGVGIFNLPTSLAVYGPITLFPMGLTTVGAIALALMFAALFRRLPTRARCVTRTATCPSPRSSARWPPPVPQYR